MSINWVSRACAASAVLITSATALVAAPSVAAPSAAAASAPAASVAAAPAASVAMRPLPAPAAPRPASAKVVYLTFDDGPNATYTPQVLALLKRYNARATFFMLGQNAAANPKLVNAVRAQGHAIGNHTWNHPALTRLSNGAIAQQLTRTTAVLGRRACVRPPYGDHNARVDAVIRSTGAKVVIWTVDPVDWARPGSGVIASRVINRVRPGSVVLMHDGGGPRAQTVAALGQILPSLQRQGYVFRALPGC